jgi:hypothetical protein
MDGVAHQAILGADFLEKMQAVIDYPSKNIILNREKLTFSCQECASISVLDQDPLQTILTTYADLFYVKGEILKPCNLRPLVIDTGGSPPIFQRPYRTPLARRQLIEAELNSLLDMGIICHSSSPYLAPLLMVPKKDGTHRMCIDYR